MLCLSSSSSSAFLSQTALSPAALSRVSVSVLAAEAGHSPYDAGVRHIATLAGYVSYGLMALAVCFGILTTTGWARRSVKRQTLYGGHMVLAVMALSFGVLHAVSYAFQVDEHFTYLMVVVPFVQGGEAEVAMGIVGLELGLAAAISIWLQRRLGYRRWHVLHYITYAAFALSLAHTVATSPEVRSLGGVGLIVAAAAAACLLLFVLRLLPAHHRRRRPRHPAGGVMTIRAHQGTPLPTASPTDGGARGAALADGGTDTGPHDGTALPPNPRARPVVVDVDNNHCALFGICQHEAPDVFDLGVDGRLRYTAHPGPAHTEQVLQAARCCPKQAITITRRDQ